MANIWIENVQFELAKQQKKSKTNNLFCQLELCCSESYVWKRQYKLSAGYVQYERVSSDQNRPRQTCHKSRFFNNAHYVQRGAVVGWLERLDYGAESRRNIVCSRLGFAMRRLENSLSLSAQQWMGTLFELGKANAAKGEGWAPLFSSCAQDTVEI